MCDKQSLSISGALSNTGSPIFCQLLDVTDRFTRSSRILRVSRLVVDTEGIERRMPLGYGTALYNLSITQTSGPKLRELFSCDSSDWIRGRENANWSNSQWRVGKMARDIHRQRYHLCDRKNIQIMKQELFLLPSGRTSKH